MSIPLTEDTLRENEGLTRAIQIMEDTENDSAYLGVGNDTLSTIGIPQGFPGMDDTHCSTFSAVPFFPRSENSPTKSALGSPAKAARQAPCSGGTPFQMGQITPITTKHRTFEDDSPSPTPRGHNISNGDETNSLIIDFTEQFNAVSHLSTRSPSRTSRPSPKKSHTQPDLAKYVSSQRSPVKAGPPPSTPSEARHLANLLDFDIPPAPTPRSVPSITAREVESLKSSFLSQVSSLRATLSGKEAEINSLKDAVGDAERRVGEAMEEVREQRGIKESLLADKADWQQRDKDMEGLLRSVKEEIRSGEHERDRLVKQLEESERRRQQAELRVVEADSKMVSLATASTSTPRGSNTSEAGAGSSKDVQEAVDKVARDLHRVYREKHERKVSALKQSYEARWQRKIQDLETKIDTLSTENESLRLTTSTPPSSTEIQAPESSDSQSQDFQSQLDDLSSTLQSLQLKNDDLLSSLDAERAEKDTLIALAEELLSLQSAAPANNNHDDNAVPSTGAENARFRSSGLKGPGFGGGSESRIGKMGMSRSGSGGARSGIMGNIERMGRGRVGE